MADLLERLGRRQDPNEVSEMLKGLENAKGKSSKSTFQAKKNTFAVDNSNIKVDSWRMQDWDYKKPNLPTYARGLFTTKNSAGQAEIAVRGYDKFFNQSEVTETEWPNVEANTRGPYELSVKENGCIIFMAGLEDDTLVVCSKHSTGSRGDIQVSHAEWGQKWVDRHVQSVGKTRQELARTLRAMNATAVAELCDDEFEEHVLEYAPETAGLYLHGINLNLPEFATYPHALVDQFADTWGFRRTTYITKDTIDEVHKFLDNIAETGNYDGRDTEGFVIRCQSKAHTNQWHDWFFKYKFEEPYLMYRQWRECTKAIISGREPRFKKHKKITEEYLDFARRRLHSDKAVGEAYSHNHGIIKMRDEFLASRGLTGADIIRDETQNDRDIPKDIILVPVATIGCGKTTVALTLVKLFNWGHVQNDNITVKSGKPAAFAKACVTALQDAPVMIADRNNHQRRERKQLIEDVTKILPWAQIIALHYRHDRENFDAVREATRHRVLSRGDNHQTIHADTKGPGEIIGIMEGFMGRFEPVNEDVPPDNDFNLVIDLDPLASTLDTVNVILGRLHEEYPELFKNETPPTQAEIEAAIQAASAEYRIEVKHTIKSSNDRAGRQQQKAAVAQTDGTTKKKEKQMEYFGVMLPPTRINAVLEAVFSSTSGPLVARMYNILKSQRRIQSEFHVTLVHRANSTTHADLWQKLASKYNEASAPTANRDYILPDPKLDMCNIQLERLVWNDRVMAFVVRIVPYEGSQEMWTTSNETPHITVGTAKPDIKPVESNNLLAQWLREGCSQQNGIAELPVLGNVTIEGVVRGVLSR